MVAQNEMGNICGIFSLFGGRDEDARNFSYLLYIQVKM